MTKKEENLTEEQLLQKQLEAEEKQRQLEKIAEENCILRVVAGSNAYGTNLPGSDWDERGIFVDEISRVILPFNKIEQVTLTRDDIVLYELSKYMPLLLAQNPNVIELIWTEDNDVLFKNDLGQLLLDNRKAFLSKQVKDSYVGYAQSQLKRIKGHNKWINSPQPEKEPERKDFTSVVYNATDIKEYNKKVPFDGFVAFDLGDSHYSLISIEKLKTNRKPWIDNKGNINTILKSEVSIVNPDNLRPDIIVKLNKKMYEDHHTNWKEYWNWKKNRNEKRSVLEEKFGYDCYSEDTEFLTENGWKLFDEIKSNEKIAAFDKNTHNLKYETPLDKIDKIYTGEMVHLHAAHIDVLVTGNHQMVARSYHRSAKEPYYNDWEFVKADYMPETFQLIKCIKGRNGDFKEPKEIPKDYSLLQVMRIMGWYISEGCVTKNGSLLYISQSKPNSKITQRLNYLMKNLNKCRNVKVNARGISNNSENRFYFKKIGKWMREQCGNKSIEKCLPQWVFDLKPRYQMALLSALLDGDGTKKEHAPLTYVYYTISKQLADDIQKLALLLGCQTSLYELDKYNF